MTDLTKKERLTGIICYLAYSAVLTIQRHYLFALFYFALVGITIVLADKLIKNDAVKNKTLPAFFVTAVGYQTVFEVFYTTHNDLKQTLSAVAVAVFFAGIFALTDEKKLPWCIGAVPLLCVLNIKIAIGYCVLVLCLSVMNLYSVSKKKKVLNKLTVVSMLVSALALAFCVVIAVTSDEYFLEKTAYMLSKFKNPVFLLAVAVYLSVKLFQNKLTAKQSFLICIAVIISSTVFATLTLGWSAVALMSFIAPVFVGLLCLKDKSIIDAIKEDYSKNKFIFWAVIVCLLQ